MVRVYLTGAVSDFDDPFAWHDELAESDEYDHEFVNPYTLNDFGLGDQEIYNRPHEVVQPALEGVLDSDGVLVRWDDDAFLVGTSMEIKHAYEAGIPVVIWYDGYRDNLSPWLLQTSRANFESKERALDVLLGFCDSGFTFSK
jgi:hypothetical protein